MNKLSLDKFAKNTNAILSKKGSSAIFGGTQSNDYDGVQSSDINAVSTSESFYRFWDV